MNAIFTGRKRSGKTTLAFRFAVDRGGGIIIFDPKNEWRGWPGTVTGDSSGDYIAQMEKLIQDGHEIIVFHPDGDKEEAIEPLIDWVSQKHKIAMLDNWDKKELHFTLLIDEAVNVSTASRINKKVLALVAENRPEILDIYFTFQSPMDANNLLKSRVQDWYVFNTSLPNDLAYLKDNIGLPETTLQEISAMRDHEYAHFFFDGGTPIVEFYNEPDEWFIDLEYTKENEEMEEQMARDRDDDRNGAGWLENLLEKWWDDILDIFEDKGYELKKRDSRDDDRGRDRDRDRGRDRDRNRGDRPKKFEVFRRSA